MNASAYNDLLVKIQHEANLSTELRYIDFFALLGKWVIAHVTEENALELLTASYEHGTLSHGDYQAAIKLKQADMLFSVRAVVVRDCMEKVGYVSKIKA